MRGPPVDLLRGVGSIGEGRRLDGGWTVKRLMRSFGVTLGLAAGTLALGATPALTQESGATTVDCSVISPELGGTIVFTPKGNVLGNCWEHHHSPGGGSEGGPAQLVDCSEALGQPGAIGIAVFTPEGSTYINCHLHFNAGQP